jgi:GTP pyrophosphokinase
MVPLKYQLHNGDTVEIMTSKTQQPSKDWLKWVVTNKAKSKIRVFVKEEQRRRSILIGKELVEKEFRKFGANAQKYFKGDIFEQFMKDFGFHHPDDVLVAVGYGKLETKTIIERLLPEQDKVKEVSETKSFMQRVLRGAVTKTKKSGSLISVDGMDDVLVHYARCCHPIPGDPIMGFISRGRGISIHRADCQKVFEMDQDRRVDVSWNTKGADAPTERVVRVRIVAHDVPGLLKSMSEAFTIKGINIQSAQIRTTKDKKAVCNFEISVRDATQLNDAIFEIQKIKGIIGVARVMH